MISGESTISETPSLSIWALCSVAATSPHVQRGARLVGHPALLPWWIPYDVDRHRTDARDARHRILHHDRQFLRRWAVRRRERHVHGDRAVIRDVDLVDQAELIDIRGNFRIVN